MMLNILAWLTGSRLGRWLAIGGLATGIVLLALARARRQGRNAERAKAQAETLKQLKDIIHVEKDIEGLSARERRDRLRAWAKQAD